MWCCTASAAGRSGRTTWNNHYLGGRPENGFRHASMAMNVAAKVDDKLTVNARRRSADKRHAHHAELRARGDRVLDRPGFRIGQ